MKHKRPVWFHARNMGDRTIGLTASGYDKNIGQDDEQKLEVFLSCTTGTSPRKQVKKLADALNKVVRKYYGEKDDE